MLYLLRDVWTVTSRMQALDVAIRTNQLLMVTGALLLIGSSVWSLVAFSRRRQALRRPARMIFAETQIALLGGGGRFPRTVPLATIRSAEIAAAMLVITTGVWWRKRRIAVPTRALPDDGRAVMRYLYLRTTAKLTTD